MTKTTAMPHKSAIKRPAFRQGAGIRHMKVDLRPEKAKEKGKPPRAKPGTLRTVAPQRDFFVIAVQPATIQRNPVRTSSCRLAAHAAPGSAEQREGNQPLS